MSFWRFAAVVATAAAVGAQPSAANAQAKVFGLGLGDPLPALKRCPADPAKMPADICVRESSGWTWVDQPPGRYPDWADYVSMRLTLGKDRRVDRVSMRLSDRVKPEPVVASLTSRFGSPELAHKEAGFSVWRWRSEGIGAALACSPTCGLEFLSGRALREDEEARAAKQRIDAGRSPTP